MPILMTLNCAFQYNNYVIVARSKWSRKWPLLWVSIPIRASTEGWL